jgi:hypothetical protein
MSMQQQAYLAVQRLSPRTGVLRRIAVRVDTQKVGTLRLGQRGVFGLAPGEHAVYVQLGNDKSNQLVVTLAAGETRDLVVTGAFRGAAALFWPFYRGPQVDLSLDAAATEGAA